MGVPNLNAKPASRSAASGTPPSITKPGVYQSVATWRRQSTLTPAQLDPVANSAARRKTYKTGIQSADAKANGYRRVGTALKPAQ